MIAFLPLFALLVAAPATAAQDSAALQAEAAAAGKAADSAAEAAKAANRAADAAAKAADAAEKAADAAEKAANAAQRSVPAGLPMPPPPPITAQASPPVAPPAPPPPDVVWSGTINLGMIAVTGNAQSIAFNVGGAFQRKGPSWIFGFKGNASYGQTRVPASATTPESTQTTAEAASAQARGDRRLSDAVTAYLLTGIDSDHLASIEERPYGEGGVSLTWWEIKESGKEKDSDFVKTTLRTDLGFRYGREYRFQYFPTVMNVDDVNIVAPHLGVGYRYSVSKEIFFTDDVDCSVNVDGPARLLLVNTAKLAARLTKGVNFVVSLIVNYDSEPPATKETTDTALTVGVEIAL